ncbi:MAG: sulfotransferase family protein [Candidatus Electrothrix sp. AW2]|nr:sulfotransferase family protein [Candidatus Electrothrix gigas]
MSLEVIGAGFCRTGTETLKTALEQLGFAPCYHMFTLIEKHEEHVPVWENAFTGGTDIDWDFIYQGYRAAVDFPTAAFSEHLATVKYPNAKVILTIRNPEKWFESASTTTFPATLKRRAGRPTVMNMLFKGRHTEKEYAISVYNKHIDRIKQVISPERLLIYRVREGWEPLCRFLDVEIPDNVFPHRNAQADFGQLMSTLK